jgi:hypothetical protein
MGTAAPPAIVEQQLRLYVYIQYVFTSLSLQCQFVVGGAPGSIYERVSGGCWNPQQQLFLPSYQYSQEYALLLFREGNVFSHA